MTSNEDWIYDSVVGFLFSRQWRTPVMKFVEENSLVFDPEEENQLAYTEIHQNYGKLVESLLESHLDELGVSPEQFVQSCSLENAQSSFHEELFELVNAADDYELFRHIMVQKNIEMELQALEVLQRQLGTIPESMRPATTAEEKAELEQLQRQNSRVDRNKEEEHLQQALQRSSSEAQDEDQEFEANLAKAIADSQADSDHALAESQLEQQQLERALALSLQEMRENTTAQADQPVTQQPEMPIVASMSSMRIHVPSNVNQTAHLSQTDIQRHPHLSSAVSTSQSIPNSGSGPPTASAVPPTMTSASSHSNTAADQFKLPQVDKQRMLHTLAVLPGVQPVPQEASSSAASEWLKSARADMRGGLMTSPEGIKLPTSELDIEKRKAYLNSMREKLQAARRENRSKQLQPRQEPVREAWMDKLPEAAGEENQDVSQDNNLQRARALAETLRREVIETKDNEK